MGGSNTDSAEYPGKALTVMLLAPSGRDAPLMRDSLERRGVPCLQAPSVETLIDSAGPEYAAGLLLITEEALDSENAEILVRYLEKQPAWSDLPVLLLGRSWTERECLGDLLSRRNSQFLRRPLQPATLLAAVRSALEIRSRQYQIRGLLENAQNLNEQLRERAQQLQRLSLQLSDAEERERQRMAIYVHDNLQQTLAGAKFHVDLAERRLNQKEKLRGSLDMIRELVMEAIDGTRTLSQELSPVALRRYGLLAGLKWLTDHVEKLQGLRTEFRSSLDREPKEPSVVTFLFRAAQELLLNVAKHAYTDRVEIRLSNEGDIVFLTVIDRGNGFNVQEWEEREANDSFGLFSLRQRAELLGGAISIESAPEKGTTVTLSVPSTTIEADAKAGQSLTSAGKPLQAKPPSENGESHQIRIILVDDHTVMRNGLRLMLADHPEFEILGEFADGTEAVEAAERLEPDLILMDVAMPGMDGVEATRIIKEHHPAIRVIGLSMFDDERTREKMLAAGAEQYLGKAGPSEELLQAMLSPQ